MEKEVLVEVNNVSKKFCIDLKTSLRYGLQDIIKAILPFKDNGEKKLRKKEFWAVKDISFKLRRGECIGLIGHNGAGKSTLLKMINGLINPDAGSIKLKGKIGALIELGAGFNPILTGRENIYNNAAVLGFSKKEIDSKMADIIAFSEIEAFLDMPVQNYSSGMKVRLGFAIAAYLEPDILIVDEVLAVGDLGFVLKCFKKIDEILPKTAMIFVSHNMPMVSRICSHIILMDKGESKYQGYDVSKGIDLYYNRFSTNEYNVIFTDNSIELLKVAINKTEQKVPIINWNSDLKIQITIKNNSLKLMPFFFLTIFDKEQRGVAVINGRELKTKISSEIFVIEFYIERIQLSKGIYSISINSEIEYGKNPILRINNIKSFQVENQIETWPPFLLENKFKIY